MLYYNAIQPQTLELLKTLQEKEAFQSLRLVGGTALALQIGHRFSDDLDLFGVFDMGRNDVSAVLSSFPNVIHIGGSKNIHIYAINNIKVDFVNYAYPWLRPSLEIDGLRLAAIEDIAAMKMAAITGRGTKKDFIDIYYLLKRYSLPELLSFYQKKYHDGSLFLVLRSLVYFDDADNDPLPNIFSPLAWSEVKEEIRKNVLRFTEK